MARSQLVILRGRKDGINIWLDEKAAFESIRSQLTSKVSGAKHFFEGADTNIAFKGRELSESEEKELLDIILTETTLELSFVEHDEIRESEVPASALKTQASASNVPYTEAPTAYYRNGLRSGQSIRYPGSVVVIGDANPGSEIVADGNIIVMGSVKGMVHAGASGDGSCFVSALSLTPTQLRIANTITYIPVQKDARKSERKPSYAYVQDGQVYIALLTE